MDESLAELRERYEALRESRGAGDPQTLSALSELAEAYRELGMDNEAVATLKLCYQLYREGNKAWYASYVQGELAEIYQRLGKTRKP